jgi:hypothetical protein
MAGLRDGTMQGDRESRSALVVTDLPHPVDTFESLTANPQ